ncbi:hypothetical protein UlMin_003155 [Ulmus minor]
MEEITEGVNAINIASGDSYKKNRIQVSNTKKPLFFYVNLANSYMQQHNEVELSALGMGKFFTLALIYTVRRIRKSCTILPPTYNIKRDLMLILIALKN